MINPVNPNLAGCMEYFFVFDKQAHMRDLLFFVIKKCKIAGLGFRNQIECCSLLCLVGCIAVKRNAMNIKNHLHQS